jgi:hypothetical protein
MTATNINQTVLVTCSSVASWWKDLQSMIKLLVATALLPGEVQADLLYTSGSTDSSSCSVSINKSSGSNRVANVGRQANTAPCAIQPRIPQTLRPNGVGKRVLDGSRTTAKQMLFLSSATANFSPASTTAQTLGLLFK